MSARPWYKWFPGDYLQDTVHISPEADLLYRRLLDVQWRDGIIPLELEKIARISRLPMAWVEPAWPEIEGYFQRVGGRKPGYSNKRMKSLIALCSRESGAKRDAAKRRWNKELHASALNMQCDPDPDPEEEKRKTKKSNQKKVASPRAQGQSPRQQGTNPRRSPPSASPVVPDGLCQQSWDAYLAHRRENRMRALKPKSQELLMRWLVDQGPPSIQAKIVERTRMNGWTGLFQLKGNGGNGTGPPRRASPRTMDEWTEQIKQDRAKTEERANGEHSGELIEGQCRRVDDTT